MKRFAIVILTVALGLIGCATESANAPNQQQAPASFDVGAAVRAIRMAGNANATELDVQPLRDSQVEDLRQRAAMLESRRDYKNAAKALDQALGIQPDDPALLQERAEAALLLRDLKTAEHYARRAFLGGSQVGPLCRRHWETVAQVRVAQANPAGVAEARRARDACTVAAPNRY